MDVIQLFKSKTTTCKDSHLMAAAVCKDSQLQVAPWLSIVAEVKLALVDGHAEELEATDCGDCPSASRSGGFGL